MFSAGPARLLLVMSVVVVVCVTCAEVRVVVGGGCWSGGGLGG